jgi:hypothetical protein
VFLHQLGDDLVLALEFLTQRGDSLEKPGFGPGVLAPEGGCSVLEELLLTELEKCGGEQVLVAEVGHGDVVNQMSPEDGNLLGG